jgi:hypothetical protein
MPIVLLSNSLVRNVTHVIMVDKNTTKTRIESNLRKVAWKR